MIQKARELHNAGKWNAFGTNIILLILYIGIAPSQQITMLREQSRTPFLRCDIWNLNAKFKRECNRGLSIDDALIKDLKEWGIHYEGNPDKENITRHLFIALPESIKLAHDNQDVILVDNTYKTNKYDMLLLHVVGK